MSFVLADFVHSVPSPLTFALVSLEDSIRIVKNVLQVLSWRSGSLLDGFLLVFGWWAVCLLADSVLRFFLPLAVLAVYLYHRSRRTVRKQVVTEQILANAVSDLAVIPTLLPASPTLPALPLLTLLRVGAILYTPYLLVTHLIPLRLLFAIGGTLLLTWRAPFAVILRAALWRSAFVRWSVYTTWAHISGQPLPPKSISPQTLQTFASATTEDGGASPANSTTAALRFLFTIYENQRWWMGLDWTAALLPGERPSWCSQVQAPLSPPGAFTLPEPTTVYLTHPTDTSKKIKRTAEWYWEEPEWTVLVRREGGIGLSRVERPVPAATSEDAATGKNGNNAAATGSRLFKAASSRFSGASSNHSAHVREDSGSTHSSDKEHEVETGREETANEPLTDPDGWVYGDNKWENQSNKGGISKYTRFRKWTRVAVLSETTQVVDSSAESIASTPKEKRTAAPPPLAPINVTKEGAAPPSTHIASPISTSTNATTTPNTGKQFASPSLMSPPSPIPETTTPPPNPSATESPLRQRLRMALNK